MKNNDEERLTIDRSMIITIIGFLYSCINVYTLSSWMIIYTIVFCFSRKAKIALNFFIVLQIRSLLNPGVVEDISSAGMIKWSCVICVSLVLIVLHFKKTTIAIKRLSILFCVFALFLTVSAFFVSSYPLVASFKVVSFAIPFIAIIVGVSVTPKTDYIHTINLLLGAVIVASNFVYTLPVGYLRNGRSFQGLFNHPNVLGVMVAIFAAGYLYEKNNQRKSIVSLLLLIYCGFLIYSSFSRTGMISFVGVLLIGVFSLNTSRTNKFLFVFTLLLLAILLLAINETWRQDIISFLYKGRKSINDITYSRNCIYRSTRAVCTLRQSHLAA